MIFEFAGIMRIKTVTNTETDLYLHKIQTFFEKKKAPVARLKLVGTKCQVEVLWWGHRKK